MKKKLVTSLIGLMLIGSVTACGQKVENTKSKVENPKSKVEGFLTDEEVAELNKEKQSDINKNITDDTHKEIGNTETKESNTLFESNTTNTEKSIALTDKLYEKSSKENIMFSPISLNYALGLLNEGAVKDSNSYNALNDYLGDRFSDEAKSFMHDGIQDLNLDGNINGYNTVFELANSIWFADDIQASEEYINNVKDKYDAELQNIDTTNPEQSAEIINNWCSEKTHNLINSIVQPDTISTMTAAILVNSVYMESPWVDEWYTLPNNLEDFTDINDNTIQIPTIHKTSKTYYENDQAKAFGEMYKNGLEFIGILPKAEGEFTLDELNIPELIKERYTGDIRVLCSMPELDFETELNLADILLDSTLAPIFDDSLDFAFMTESGANMSVSNIIQKTKIELDKYGTKAAAVTAIVVDTNSAIVEEPRTEEVYLNRPFAFVIYDRNNDSIMFIGKVVEF